MSADIEHETSVLEAGRIDDAHYRQCILRYICVGYLGHDIGGEHLLYTLECIVETIGFVGGNGNAVGCDVKGVAFVAEFFVTCVHRHCDQCVVGVFLYLNAVACHFAEERSEFRGFGCILFVEFSCSDSETFGQQQAACSLCHLHRKRGKVYITICEYAHWQADEHDKN